MKTKIFILISMLFLTSLITGCLTTSIGPKFTQSITPESGKAVIYVYRQRGVMTATTMPGIKVNDVEVVEMLPEIGYFSLSVDPGQYTFTPKLFGIYKTTETTANAQPGEVYFVRLKVSMGSLEFDLMNKDEAMAYMATCHLLDSKYYRDPRVMSGQKVSMHPAPVISKEIAAVQTQADVKQVPDIPVEEKAPTPVSSRPVAVKDLKGRLYVDVNPSNARIRIMNISPVFEQGITLDQGRYDLEVSAAGYNSHREWVTLEKGESKNFQVLLEPVNKPAPVAEQPVIKEQTVVVSSLTAEQKANVSEAFSAEEERYARMLQNGSLTEIRDAAKNIYYRHYNSSYLAAIAEQALLKHYSADASNIQVDAMAWLCKALGKTGDRRYAETLRTVAQNAPHRKLRGHAEKSLAQL
ncbi:MAG: DUF2846 domain-containing protein [Deltaproteobacteria bacterium]|nr:DUF2846 domain-containing protein [Deltaproteobacteria bacterium]